MYKRPLPFYVHAVEDGGDGGGSGKPGEKPGEFTPITSQDDLNKVIADRVARERAKFADYKDVKAKAERLDQIEQENKTEAEKVAARIAALEAENQRIQSDALRSRIQARHSISDEDAELFLTGTDEETLTRQAERLAGKAADRKMQGNVAPREGGNPNPVKSDDMRSFANELFGRAVQE